MHSYTKESITRIDCHFFRGLQAAPEASSFSAFNPEPRPGSLVLAGSTAVRVSIGSQVACKLAIQYFTEGVMNFFAGEENPGVVPRDSSEVSLQILEGAFKTANSSVYNFGHKLSAGGRMAASLIGLVIEDHLIAAGRVGVGCAYLCRSGDVFPFFEYAPTERTSESADGFVGSQSMVSVELASVPVQSSDVVLVTSNPLDLVAERELGSVVQDLGLQTFPWGGKSWGARRRNPCEVIMREILSDPDGMEYAMLALVGPKTIYLESPTEPLEERKEAEEKGEAEEMEERSDYRGE